VLDGDGGLLMNLHTLVTCAAQSPGNLLHVCFDNGIYESSGGTPTFTGSSGVSFAELARASGVKNVRQPGSIEELRSDVKDAIERQVHTFIHVRVEPIRPKVPNIALDEVENKYRFVRYVEATEGITILTGSMAGAPHKT
jgi:thiamine pyrophosphate-dependent acetolactate synthase large subunit-like protein